MAVSDLMVTKAGGISVTEALNSRIPMILFGSIPGQETWNEQLLTSCGAAEKVDNMNGISALVDRILLSEEVYESLMEGIDKLRRPDAAEKIVDIVLGEIGR
jgi:processive 1,2-diacylglycerol beta-glucosyltransferase